MRQKKKSEKSMKVIVIGGQARGTTKGLKLHFRNHNPTEAEKLMFEVRNKKETEAYER